MMGKILLIFLTTLTAGMVLGAIVYNHYYRISEPLLEKYDLFFTFFPALALFVAGFFAGRHGSSKRKFDYKPMFQGRPQQLGQEGERLLMSSMKRVGLVREGGGGRG